MTACNDCWDEAFRRSQIGGNQVDQYEAILLLPPDERPWCGTARRLVCPVCDGRGVWMDEPCECAGVTE